MTLKYAMLIAAGLALAACANNTGRPMQSGMQAGTGPTPAITAAPGIPQDMGQPARPGASQRSSGEGGSGGQNGTAR